MVKWIDFAVGFPRIEFVVFYHYYYLLYYENIKAENLVELEFHVIVCDIFMKSEFDRLCQYFCVSFAIRLLI